jgi:hypothetical protein
VAIDDRQNCHVNRIKPPADLHLATKAFIVGRAAAMKNLEGSRAARRIDDSPDITVPSGIYDLTKSPPAQNGSSLITRPT